MIEIRRLHAFAVVCRHPSLSGAALELGISVSTLSTTLKRLESECGIALFSRERFGLAPLPAAHWMYRACAPILALEAFSRRVLRSSKRRERAILTVEVCLDFEFGHLNNAIHHAIQLIARSDPHVLIDLHWRADAQREHDDRAKGDLNLAIGGRVRVDVSADVAARDDRRVSLLVEPWTLGFHWIHSSRDARAVNQPYVGKVVVPPLPERLCGQLQSFLRQAGAIRAHFSSDPIELPTNFFLEHPDSPLLAPASWFHPRLGMPRMRTAALRPPLAATLLAEVAGEHPVATRFADSLRRTLNSPQRSSADNQVTSARRIAYFNMLMRARRVSVAAQMTGISQPAMSDQLRKLEHDVRTRLFDRHVEGLAPTAKGLDYAPLATAMERGLKDIQANAKAVQRLAHRRLHLGILPSVSQYGYLVNRVTDAVLAVKSRHKDLKVVVTEGPTDTLQRWVEDGLVGMAIVDKAIPDMPRLPLCAPEPLAAIVDPRHALFADGPVSLSMLTMVPLALPSSLFGLRQTLDGAAREQNLQMAPVLEIDGLAMLIAVLNRERICTVLPASAVQRELDQHDLVAHPVVSPQIFRKLFVIYSANRSLTVAERDLVSTLQVSLANAQSEPRGPPSASSASSASTASTASIRPRRSPSIHTNPSEPRHDP